jgi:hypothetical protein
MCLEDKQQLQQRCLTMRLMVLGEMDEWNVFGLGRLG